MKKFAMIAVALALTLTACGNSQPQETHVPIPTEETVQVTEVPAETEAPTIPMTEPPVTEVQETLPPETEPLGISGTLNARTLNVRKSPDINAPKVGQLRFGAQVTVLEEKTVNGMNWGRISEGWICLDYICWSDDVPVNSPAPQEKEVQKELPEHEQTVVPPQTIPREPAVTLPPQTEPPAVAPTPDPAPTEAESTPTAPAVCQHQWVPIQNFPAEYEYSYYVVCSCGESFSDTAAWAAHRDSFLGTEDLASHTGYSSGSEKNLVTPAMTLWQCSQCGASKTIRSDSNP